MSSPLAIAGVTAVLKDLLNDGLLNHDLSSIGSFTVTALPPDRITTGQNETNQLNVFLYQISANAAMRNNQLPSRDANGTRLSNQPLALDLHYLLTAYGSEDFNAEILLGYAMHLLHETPILSRAQLRTVLGGVSPIDGTILPSPFGALSAADLADQFELIKITPNYLPAEDLSKIWAAMQSRYRPTMAYVVSVVLIEATSPSKVAPPVLKRGPKDSGPVALAGQVPILSYARPLASDVLPAARLGEDILLSGSGFADPTAMTAVFTMATRGIEEKVDPQAGPRAGTLKVNIGGANSLERWASGVYLVHLQAVDSSKSTTPPNSVPIALAPTIQLSANTAAAGASITLECRPRIRPLQVNQTMVIFGSETVPPDSVTTPGDTSKPSTVTFTIPAVDPGEYLVRLRVDDVESLGVVSAGIPPQFSFDPSQQITVQP